MAGVARSSAAPALGCRTSISHQLRWAPLRQPAAPCSRLMHRQNMAVPLVAAAARQPDQPVAGGAADGTSSPAQQPRLPGALMAGVSAAVLGFALLAGKAHAAEQPRPAAAPVTTDVLPTASVTAAAKTAKGAAAAPSTFDLEALSYRLMLVFAMPAYGKLATCLAVIVPLMVFGILSFRQTAPDTTWREALRRIYMLVGGIPGAGGSVDSGKGFAADVVLHIVFWARLCTFCIVLGLVTEAISSQVHAVRRGNHRVVERRHTVLLNWNKQTLPVLQQIALAHDEAKGKIFREPVVILADKDKEQMDQLVADELGGKLHVVTRSGNPARLADQRRAAVEAADTVVLLWPSGLSDAEAAAQQAAVLLTLEAAGGLNGQKVVVQSAGALAAKRYNAAQIAVNKVSSANDSRQVASLATSGSERIHQLMAQVASQPGLEAVFSDLLKYEATDSQEAGGAEFYMKQCPANLEGKVFQYVRRSYSRATLVGFISGLDKQVALNPADTTIVPPGSKLVFVASSATDVVPLPTPYEVSPLKLSGKVSKKLPARNVTVLCFETASAASAVRSIAEFSSKGSTITVVCDSPDMAALSGIRARGVKINVVAGNPCDSTVLNSASSGLAKADAVVLSGLNTKDSATADMQVVASVLQLQSIAEASTRSSPLAIVATLNGRSSFKVLQQATAASRAELRARAAAESRATPPPLVTLHLLRPDELLSGMLTQTASSPPLAAVFRELFTQQEGNELYLKDAKAGYGLPLGTPLKWADVLEVVHARGDTAVGYASAGLLSQRMSGQDINLAIHADAEVVLQQGDQLVVISLD